MKNIEGIVRSAVILIGIIATAYIAQTLGSQYMKNKAVDGCIEASKTTIVNTDASSWNGTNEGWYVRCMEEKGMK